MNGSKEGGVPTWIRVVGSPELVVSTLPVIELRIVIRGLVPLVLPGDIELGRRTGIWILGVEQDGVPIGSLEVVRAVFGRRSVLFDPRRLTI
jgi:hypothetical protein